MDNIYSFQRRPLTKGEATELISEIAVEPNITGYSISEWMGGKDVFLLYDKSRSSVAAAILVHHMLCNWSEIAVVFVRPSYRGNQLARRLLQSTVETLHFSNRQYVIFYSEQRMEGMLGEVGFLLHRKFCDFLRLNIGWRLYFSVLYKLQWLFNAYRIKEIIRKRKLYGKIFTFSVGFLD